MEVFGPEYHEPLKWRMNRFEFWLALAYQERGDNALAREALDVALKAWMRYRGISARQAANIVLTVRFPRVLKFLRRLRGGRN
jgi:hypothetical protein